MQYLDPGVDLGPNTDIDQVFTSLLHLVRNRSLARYLSDHPTAYSELIAAVQDIPPPKPLLTPASTPHDDDLSDEQAPAPLPSKSTGQEEARCDSRCLDLGDPCADADYPRATTATDRSLLHHDVSPPYEANSNGHNRDPPDVVQPLEHDLMRLASHQLYTTGHASFKRKQACQGGRASKRTCLAAANAAGGAWSAADNRISAAVLIQTTWRSRKQAEAWRRYRRKIVLVQSLWRARLAFIAYNGYKHNIIIVQSLWRCRRALRAYKQCRRNVVNIQRWWRGNRVRRDDEFPETTASAERNTLSAEWRSIIQRISSIKALQDCQEFCRQIRNPVTQIDVHVNQHALERSEPRQAASDPDRRVAQLGFLIPTGDEKVKSIKNLAWVFRVWKRMHVVELAERYMEGVKSEDALPEQDRGPSVMNRFTDLMFPATRGKGNGKISRGEHREERRKAVRKVEYWKRLGMALLGTVQCYGYGILIRLPRDLTERRLNRLLQHQRQEVVDYIELCHPGLKEQIRDLSALFPGLEEHGLQADRWLVIETIPSHELKDHPKEFLFQFSKDRDSEPLIVSTQGTSPTPVSTDDDASPSDGTGEFYSNHSTEAQSGHLDRIENVQDPLQDRDLDFPTGSDRIQVCPSPEPFSDYPLPPLQPSTLWAGDCELNLSGEAISARHRMVQN